ncbi:MAG: ABC transporter permease [Sumerlaeia bacterium]
MIGFFFRRLLLAIPLVLAASLIIFLIFELSNVDPAQRYLGERSQNEEVVQQLREEWGLNDPAPERYVRFVWNAMRGDFGKSIRTGRPVADEIRERLPATIELAGAALLLSTIFGLVSGIVAGLKRNSIYDYTAMSIALLGVSLPVFWLALLLAWLFGQKLGWLPLDQRYNLIYSGTVPTRTGLWVVDAALSGNWDAFKDGLAHLVLPAVTLAAVSSALVARMTRSSILEVVRADFIRTAEAKGVSRARWLWHVLRNALIPVVTIIGLEIPALLGGAVITETIFTWPGMGSLLIESILFGDIPAVQGLVMFLTVLFVVANILVDITYAVLDPRIRVGKKA